MEADFATTYQIDNPFGLGWRRFLVLLRGLPSNSRFVSALREEKEWADGTTWRRALDASMGLEPAAEVNRISLDDFIAGGGING